MAFKKNIVVGVSVNPEVGLEVAQIDFMGRTVLKYASTAEVKYDKIRRQIADLDIFKESLGSLIASLQIPKGSEVVLNIPTVMFKIGDYPAALSEGEVQIAIEEEISQNPIFQNEEPSISAVRLPNSSIQFNKIAYTVSQKNQLIEIATIISDLGLKLVCIDTSVNSTLNALMYNSRVDVAADVNWLLLVVENDCCRIASMQGCTYVDAFEERISIGEVLGDDENYSTVVTAVNPLLANLPSQRLYVVSKTNIISAEVLASKLVYNSQIIHEEANSFAKAPFLEVGPLVEEDVANRISIDVIGAAINRDFAQYSVAHINLFNEALGDIYTLSQPPVLKFGSLTFVLSMENMLVASIVVAVILGIVGAAIYFPFDSMIKAEEDKVASMKSEIATHKKYIAANKDVSAEKFNESDEIRIGLEHNKKIYSYYSIVGTEIPRKLWLTSLNLGDKTTIEGQADNLESVYSFYRNIKDYNPSSGIKLQKLALASNSKFTPITEEGVEETFDTDSILTSLNADFYEFRITDAPDSAFATNADSAKGKGKKLGSAFGLGDLESVE